jgi:hypothetical protein
LKGWQIAILVVIVTAAAGYLGRYNILRGIDAYAYEPTLQACVGVLGWVEPTRLQIELRAFCNAQMIQLAAQAAEAADS